MATFINFGCGQSPTAGWINYDNSPSVLLAKWRPLAALLRSVGLIDANNQEFIDLCRTKAIRYADAGARLPHDTASVDAIYSSHMLEHMFRDDAEAFLEECHRILRPGGVLRLAVPDLEQEAREYLEHGDADQFLRVLEFDLAKPRGLTGRLRRALLGGRGHRWFYDRRSLQLLIEACGFIDVDAAPPGATRIKDYGALDLEERAGQGLCLEATRP
jgi:SAM-dependent methyltransferase